MEKSARRISSIFSLGSTSSDKSKNSNLTPSVHAPRESRSPSPARLPQLFTSTLQPSESLQNLRTPSAGPSPHLSPAFDPGYSISTLPDNALPQGVCKPAPLPPGSLRPIRPGSTPGTRPSPPPINFSRPASSGGSRPVSPSRDLRPITPNSDSGMSSRPPSRVGLTPISRPISPSKHPSRPTTPIPGKKLSNRRSWLPGRSRHGSVDETDGERSSSRAWVLTPDQQRPYDVSPLIKFQRVSNVTLLTAMTKCSHFLRFQNSGMNAGILLSTFTHTYPE